MALHTRQGPPHWRSQNPVSARYPTLDDILHKFHIPLNLRFFFEKSYVQIQFLVKLQSTAEIYDEVSSELDETITTDDFNEDKTVAGININYLKTHVLD